MEIGKKALYNLMRMNWLLDPSLPAEPWQVEDYRSISLDTLFKRLSAHDIRLDKVSFTAFAEEAKDPEDLTEQLLSDVEANAASHDQVYLLVFELWRRLSFDRACLSVFCDELDYRIYQYDHAKEKNWESLQDAVANLQTILDENADNGIKAEDVFDSITDNCANDIESFLYDYILDQIDSGQISYAGELLDGFLDYVSDPKWFHFLRARLFAASSHEMIPELVEDLISHDEWVKIWILILRF